MQGPGPGRGQVYMCGRAAVATMGDTEAAGSWDSLAPPSALSHPQLYQLDVAGYLVLPGALTPAEVAAAACSDDRDPSPSLADLPGVSKWVQAAFDSGDHPGPPHPAFIPPGGAPLKDCAMLTAPCCLRPAVSPLLFVCGIWQAR
eukprot:SAG22_NODE_4148_length_1368_cov_0.917258_2_plen_145_part_00